MSVNAILTNGQLPHVHLLSTYRYPAAHQVHPEKVTEWLINAPRIARDQAPFYWTYLDRPVDGSIYLVWQSPALGAEFPSDGYIWAPGETAFQLEVGGFVRFWMSCRRGVVLILCRFWKCIKQRLGLRLASPLRRTHVDDIVFTPERRIPRAILIPRCGSSITRKPIRRIRFLPM